MQVILTEWNEPFNDYAAKYISHWIGWDFTNWSLNSRPLFVKDNLYRLYKHHRDIVFN